MLTEEGRLLKKINRPNRESLRLTDCEKPWFGLHLV